MPRKTIDDVLRSARARLTRLSARQAYEALRAGAVLVDVRTEEQRDRDGRVPQALEISLNVLEWRLDPDSATRLERAPALDQQLIVLCAEGYCSSLAATRLQDLGFVSATDVIDGFEGWRRAGLPVLVERETAMR